VVLGMLLVISLAAVIAFLILPLVLSDRSGRHQANLAGLLYFIAIGLGYIFVEISLIQRFVLFLGHPTYALTVVVFLLLLSSGAGSVAARRWILNSGNARYLLALIASLILLDVAVVPSILGTAVGQPFIAKLLISATLLVPLGFLMGMPFPAGLKLVAESGKSTVEWAWAMNAAASVLGSVSAMVVAIHFGLTITLACAALAYLLAAAFSRTWKNPLIAS
jgi:hypothetical protein